MNITILAIGSRGDVQPFVALGKVLKDAGHAVRIGTDAGFESLARSVGIDFAPVAGDTRAVLQSAGGRIVEDFLSVSQDADGLSWAAWPFSEVPRSPRNWIFSISRPVICRCIPRARSRIPRFIAYHSP